MIREQYTLGRAPGGSRQDPPRDNSGTSFGPGTSRYCLFYWSVTPIFFFFFPLFHPMPSSSSSSNGNRDGRFKEGGMRSPRKRGQKKMEEEEEGRNGKGKEREGGGKKERKEEIIFDRMFRRGGSEFRIGGGARGARILSRWWGWVR